MLAAVPATARSPRARAHRGLRRLLESRVVGALATPHGVDHHLATFGARWATAHPPARVVEARRSTPGTVTLTLRPGPAWAGHQPGQHVVVTVPVRGARRSRCFSVASSAHRDDGLIELTVKATGRAGVSDHLVAAARRGQLIEMSMARGDFVLPQRRPDHVVLVSGGSGITPLLAMVRTLDDEDFGGPVSFLHYARTAADVLAGDELGRLAARRPSWRVVVALTGPDARPDAGPTGRFRPEHLEALAPGAVDAPVWVCGPAGLAAHVAAVWGEAGPVNVERYRLGPLPSPTGTGGRVRFVRSGVEVVDDGRPLLVQAEGAGLAPDHGCRAGQCHTCIRRTLTGAVRDVRTGDVLDEPDQLVQICVAAPVGDIEIDL
jgi:stearoyl-CoA 9-desaturase NADPH oxidoreductase